MSSLIVGYIFMWLNCFLSQRCLHNTAAQQTATWSKLPFYWYNFDSKQKLSRTVNTRISFFIEYNNLSNIIFFQPSAWWASIAIENVQILFSSSSKKSIVALLHCYSETIFDHSTFFIMAFHCWIYFRIFSLNARVCVYLCYNFNRILFWSLKRDLWRKIMIKGNQTTETKMLQLNFGLFLRLKLVWIHLNHMQIHSYFFIFTFHL